MYRSKQGQFRSLKQKANDNRMARITMGVFVALVIISTLLNLN